MYPITLYTVYIRYFLVIFWSVTGTVHERSNNQTKKGSSMYNIIVGKYLYNRRRTWFEKISAEESRKGVVRILQRYPPRWYD